MRPEESPYVDLCPSLDLIRSRPLDAPHSEWRGLGRILQALLIQEILTKAGASAYLQAFQKFPFRHNWPRIQSPLYIWSWSLSEAGRATLLTPLILRCKSRTAWFRLRFVQEFARLNEDANDNQSIIDSIIRAYAIVAMVNSVTGSQVYTPPETLHNQSIRLGLAGAWSYDYPVLQEPLKLVENLCPKLTKSFLPRASFATDYNIRGIVAFKDRRLRWKQRLAFNDQCVFP
jgi:hypothetical protein